MVSYCGSVEPVFKALADPTRRGLLDELFRRDGQTLGGLASGFDMTRVAVAKHLRLLEDAGLVATRRRDREKLEFLNPVPLARCQDRPRPTPISVGLGNLLESVEHDLPVLRETLCLLLAVAAVLGERDGRVFASLRQLVAEIVVVLGHVVITGQRTVVGDLEEPAWLSREHLTLVPAWPVLPLARSLCGRLPRIWPW